MADLSDFNELRTKDPYDPRAHGLNGEILDAMLKSAFTEGVLAERKVQQEAGKRAAQEAFNEGRTEGANQGREVAIREHAGAAYGRGYSHAANATDDLLRYLQNDKQRLSRKWLLSLAGRIEEHLRSGTRVLRAGERGYSQSP